MRGVKPITPPTTPQTGSEIHRVPRLQTHTICMGENFLKSLRQFQIVRRRLKCWNNFFIFCA